MIDRQRWTESLKATALGDSGGGGSDGDAGDEATAAFHIPPFGSLVLHTQEQGTSLMRLVCEEATRDAEQLTADARKLEDYALQKRKEKSALPLYASATPNGRLVANFCACSPFDETDEALAALHGFLADDPLGCRRAR